MQAPYLILRSEDDGVAPFGVISTFVHRLKDIGGDVKLVKWRASPHVGQCLGMFCLITQDEIIRFYLKKQMQLGCIVKLLL